MFVKRGDARAEVDSLLKELGTGPEEAGFHKYIFVAQVHQTVVMLTGGDAPLAGALRAGKDWQEPAAGAGR